jgi:hypothetical protein
MGHQFEMGYLGFQVDDPEALGAYLRDVLGLQSGSPPGPDVEAWRLDGKAGRLFVHRGPESNSTSTDPAVGRNPPGNLRPPSMPSSPSRRERCTVVVAAWAGTASNPVSAMLAGGKG